METVWIGIGDTKILMRLEKVGVRKEWEPIAQVTRRQVYESIPPKWYVWDLKGRRDVDMTIGQFDDIIEACVAAENYHRE